MGFTRNRATKKKRNSCETPEYLQTLIALRSFIPESGKTYLSKRPSCHEEAAQSSGLGWRGFVCVTWRETCDGEIFVCVCEKSMEVCFLVVFFRL